MGQDDRWCAGHGGEMVPALRAPAVSERAQPELLADVIAKQRVLASARRVDTLRRADDDEQVGVRAGGIPDGAHENAAAEPCCLMDLSVELLSEHVDQGVERVRRLHIIE